MSSSLILVNVEPPETRIAELRERRLFDFFLERDGRLLGDIFKGEVENILPGMDAAFINIGLERNALIYAGDVGPVENQFEKPQHKAIESLLHAGDEIIVQIARPPVGSKGARVTTRLSLPGRYSVLVANSDSVGVSRRIESEEERARLRRLADRARPFDHSIIVRTEAENVTEDEFFRDIAALKAQLQSISQQAAKAQAPTVLHRDLGLLGRLARDRLNDNVEAVIIDNEEVYQIFRDLVQATMPRYLDRIQLYNEPTQIFHRYHIHREIAIAMSRTVALPSGGTLIIDEAEALTAIDVNTKKFVGKSRLADTVLKTNLEAVDEAARQIRLRDIGGVIVIDFIDMERNRDRIQVMNALDAALKQDRTRTRIVQLSPLGLVEMTRRREGSSLRQLVNEPCPYCAGSGVIKSAVTVALEVRRRVRELALSATEGASAVKVTLHPEIACAFIGADAEHAADLEATTHIEVLVRVDMNMHLEASRIETLPVQQAREDLGEFKPGARLHLHPNLPLYPEAAPQYTAWHGMLILLDNLGDDSLQEKSPPRTPAVIEIVEVGHWFIKSKVLTFNEQ